MSHSDYRVTSEMNSAVKCPSGTEPTQRDLHLRLITERGRMAWQRPPAITSGRRWRRTSAATSRVVACADRRGAGPGGMAGGAARGTLPRSCNPFHFLPPQYGTEAGEQFPEAEWFYNIVVRPELRGDLKDEALEEMS